ncbi:glycosyltransferase family 1 protein [Peniophora sp. CONT]|nr:glycosyltransferase family 1 protein [Peniophora sp. CONT]
MLSQIRAGTQTLIQLLQALPWSQGEDDEGLPFESMHPAAFQSHSLQSPPSSASYHPGSHSRPSSTQSAQSLSPAPGQEDVMSDGSESDDGAPISQLSSSLHTIHRPFRSRRDMARSERLPPVPDTDSEAEETEGEDFDATSTPSRVAEAMSSSQVGMDGEEGLGGGVVPSEDLLRSRAIPRRQDSLSTVKTVRHSRRAKLAVKLAEVFELDGITEVVAEIPCWLMRAALLQGHMFLTDTYLCFFAHIPARSDTAIRKSGTLTKKTQRTKRWVRRWFVLKNDSLCWYSSASDPYFPHGVLDLRYTISVEPVGDKGLRVRTTTRSASISADSVVSRDEWVKAIHLAMFEAQNSGESVKIAIPYSAIVDVDIASPAGLSETLEVKVLDTSLDASNADALAVDSFFFAYFANAHAAMEQVRGAVAAARVAEPRSQTRKLVDTTVSKTNSPPSSPGRDIGGARGSAGDAGGTRPSSFRFTSLLRPFTSSSPPSTATPSTSASSILPTPEPVPESDSDAEPDESFTHVQTREGSRSFVPVTLSPSTLHQKPSSESMTPTMPSKGLTYPPSTVKDSALSWLPTPAWLLRTVPRRILSSTSVTSPTSAPPTSEEPRMEKDMIFSVLETPNSHPPTELIDKFRTTFALDARETLLGVFPGFLFRMLPVYGRLYISDNWLCFKAGGSLGARTRMMLPLRDIMACEPAHAFSFGHHGLAVIVRGHEELFLEFSAPERRAQFRALLDKRLEEIQRAGPVSAPVSARPALLDELRPGMAQSVFGIEGAKSTFAHAEERERELSEDRDKDSDVPGVMFASSGSTFLTFKPEKSLHFTLLTIGSRGDVQPYIALAKRLMLDGHRVRIATHGEFKDWVESFGIEFGYVGGDPAELMRICVENGTFTIAFLREGVLKFRDWIEDLLKTSWLACQGTDVLVESPSAMAGYHIAEALRIPYFRAFTMPWSRTRAYPHAFAVPERKMGGGYNYMTYVMFDQVFWRGTAGQINRWRRTMLNLPPTSLDRIDPHRIPFLYNFSPTVVPVPLDWPEHIRITGYWFLDDADVSARKWTPPQPLEDFLARARTEGKKVVYIGFGSIVVSDPRALTRAVVQAIVQSGVYAILSKGWSDRLSKGAASDTPEEPLPDCIYPVSAVPHDWLFARIDAACHHGGAGTTGASLRAGIPTIVRPFFGDQFFWADRVEALGMGVALREKELSADALAAALHQATRDARMIQRARMVGEQIRSEDGAGNAVESLYRDMERARSLFPPRDDEVDTMLSPNAPPSEDWSVIGDPEDLTLSSSSSRTRSRSRSKRNSITSAMISVIPNALSISGRRRSRSRSNASATGTA